MSRPALPPAPTYAQLRAFHAVAVARSFTEAAQTLGVSQPAVSMHVRALEEAYGVELITRGRAGVDPTELGRALLDTTRPMFSFEAEAAELLQRKFQVLPGVLAGAVTAFAAGLGEFGAVITFVSNIPGETRTLPLALYSALQSPDGDALAARLALLSFGLGLAGLLGAELLSRGLRRWLGR